MAGSFAFYPYGLSQVVAVGTAASTITLNVVTNAGTTTTVSNSGNYRASSWRMANMGSGNVFLALGTTTESVTPTTGMCVRGATDIVIGTRGQNLMIVIASAATTVCVTPGEGII